MPSSRYKPPYWRRAKPKQLYDIAKLRPATLPLGQRFETPSDVRKESLRSEVALAAHRVRSDYASYLQDCRDGYYHCEKTYCPKCARAFRRHTIGELFRLNAATERAVHILVVLLAVAPRGKLTDLEIAYYRHSLRKRLDRAGLGEVPVIGGFEVAYRARTKEWVLHVNLVMFGGDEQAIGWFEAEFRDDELDRPVQCVTVVDPPEQLSYVLKFSTYHRPQQQTGWQKSKAMPLNPAEHFELIRWMAQYEFTDHLFLYNARRHGASIEFKETRKACTHR